MLWLTTFIILIGYLIECAYMGVIPVLAILKGAHYDYTTFGIPTFHVILVTFSSFWAVFVFHNYISQKKKHLLLCYIVCLSPAILIFNRGMFLLNLASSFFVLFMAVKNAKKLILKAAIFLIALLFLFGVAGNIRATGGESINDIILSVGQASESFKKSIVPDEFFWSYLYLTTPLATVQETINAHPPSPFSLERLGAFINWEFLPDFIAKRNIFFLQQQEHIDQVSYAFNVGTVYARSFAYFRWWGVIAMFFFIAAFNFLIILILPKKSIFFVTGISILNCLMLFNIFDNMFSFSGLSMQLFYPVLFSLFPRVRLPFKASDENEII
ncbi:MAG: hypothetical protein ABJA79_08005 [Parafilimonas sp.]